MLKPNEAQLSLWQQGKKLEAMLDYTRDNHWLPIGDKSVHDSVYELFARFAGEKGNKDWTKYRFVLTSITSVSRPALKSLHPRERRNILTRMVNAVIDTARNDNEVVNHIELARLYKYAFRMRQRIAAEGGRSRKAEGLVPA